MIHDDFSVDPPKRRPFRKVLMIGTFVVAMAGFLVAGGTLFYVAHLAGDVPDAAEALARLGRGGIPQATEVFDRSGRKIGEFAAHRRYYVSLKDLPRHVVDAFVAAEDKDFWSHHGVSIPAVVRAAYANLRGRRITQGASTITQQLVRMTLLHRKRIWSRKVKEALLAFALETRLSKREILELYLNRIFLGNHSYGIEAAARNYFRKHARDLNIGEAALLAGLPQAPSRLAPHRHPERASRRQAVILARMAANGFLSRSEASAWTSQAVAVESEAEELNREAPYFLATVRREYTRMFPSGLRASHGLRIHTTLDPGAQRAVAPVLEAGLARVRRQAVKTVGAKGEVQGAVVSLDPRTGAVRAMQGGSSFAVSQFNRAAEARRRIGGLMGPLLAAVALEQGMSLTSPLKEKRRRRGLTLYEALIEGRTMAMARLYTRFGAGTVRGFAGQLGFKFHREDLLLALGYGEATPLRVAAAYAAIASGGKLHSPYLIEKVISSEGHVLYDRSKARVRLAMHPGTAEVLNRALQDSVRYGLGKAASGVRDDVSGAAGATDDLHNSWFAGSLPHLTTVVWVGAERGRIRLAASEAATAVLAARVWKEYMLKLPGRLRDQPGSFPATGSVSYRRHPRRFSQSPARRMVPFRM